MWRRSVSGAIVQRTNTERQMRNNSCTSHDTPTTDTGLVRQYLPGVPMALSTYSREIGFTQGAYTIQDVALYLRATTPALDIPLNIWQRQRRRSYVQTSAKSIAAWIREGLEIETITIAPHKRTVSFQDLVRMRMVSLLRTRSLPLYEILEAEDFARKITGSRNPFVTEPLWTSGSEAFLEFHEKLIAIYPQGQYALDILYNYLSPVHHGLQFGSDHYADSWHPHQSIRMDPKVSFGAPCVESTRIKTESLWALYKSGDSPEYLARAYGIHSAKVKDALGWENLLENAN